jgi:type II secretory pathway pseudopilin PulG
MYGYLRLKTATARTVGFTLIELLSVVATVAILASLLLGAVSQGKRTAKNTRCKSNLRQIGLALKMYEDESGAYPHVYTALNDDHSQYSEWDQLLQPYLSNVTPGYQVGTAARTKASVQEVFFCPFISPNLKEFPWRLPLYGYNALGLGWDGKISRGLDGFRSDGFGVYQKIREADIVVPSQMLEFGDPFVRSESKDQDPSYQYYYGWRPARAGSPIPREMWMKNSRTVRSHANTFNRLFVDLHGEPEKFTRPFVASDEYLRQWNYDHEPHRESWQPLGAGF